MTPADFKARYPGFTPVDDSLVTAVLDEGEREVARFIEVDKLPAALAWTAHRLTLEGQPDAAIRASGDADAIAALDASDLASLQVGDVRESYAGRGSASDRGTVSRSASGYELTPYGEQFLRYLRRNTAGPRAV